MDFFKELSLQIWIVEVLYLMKQVQLKLFPRVLVLHSFVFHLLKYIGEAVAELVKCGLVYAGQSAVI